VKNAIEAASSEHAERVDGRSNDPLQVHAPTSRSPVLIEARGLGKAYPKVFKPADRLRALWHLSLGRRSPDAVSVLSDIDFRIHRGQSLGVIGENGAGKSTLLKLISGVLTPTSGSVQVNGTVAALLELGAGFHPEYSGRDNITIAAALLGMSAADIEACREEIIEFADLGDYIDEPIKHYSTGMVVRLGFAIVATRQPDILITDEVLAVGDESFQKKCVRWIEQYVARGGTLLLVSHSMYHIQKLCRHALWLQDGRVAQYGEVFEVTQSYLAYHERKTASDRERHPQATGADQYRITEYLTNGQASELHLALDQGADLAVEVEIHSPDDREPQLLVGLLRADGTPVYGFGSEMDGIRPSPRGGQRYAYRLCFERLALLPGHYTLRVFAMDPEGLRIFDMALRDLIIRGETREMGMVRLAHHWGEG
jgi:lipopolysaccharide transport system ATP-binding protein